MKRTLLFVLALIAAGPVDGVAQKQPARLKGLTTVNLENAVIVGWNELMPSWKPEAQYRAEAEVAFELGILRAGLKTGKGLEDAPPGSPHCILDVRPVNPTTLFVVLRVGWGEIVVPWEAAELAARGFREVGFIAETWYEQSSDVLPITDLNGTEDGQWCAEQFELAWRRANN
jgi:hypothetical protein